MRLVYLASLIGIWHSFSNVDAQSDQADVFALNTDIELTECHEQIVMTTSTASD